MHEIFDNNKLYKNNTNMSGAKRVRFDEELPISAPEAKVRKTAEALTLEMEETIISAIDVLRIPDNDESDLIKELMEILFKMIFVIFQTLEEHGYRKMPHTELFVFTHRVHSHVCIKLIKNGFLLEYKDALEDNNELVKIAILPNSAKNEIVISSSSENTSPLSLDLKQRLIDNFGDAE